LLRSGGERTGGEGDPMTDLTIVNTIWSQIPIAIKLACGARDPKAADEHTLIFTVARGLRYVQIQLNGRDLYDIRHFRLKRGTLEAIPIDQRGDVYAEDLGECLYHMINK
jgi:hypothetical protein